MKREILKPSLLLILLLAGSLAVAQDSIVVSEVADGGDGRCVSESYDSCGDGCLSFRVVKQGTDYKKAVCPSGFFLPGGAAEARYTRSFSCDGGTKISAPLELRACFRLNPEWSLNFNESVISITATPDGGDGRCSSESYDSCGDGCLSFRVVKQGADYQKLSCPTGYVLYSRTSGPVGQENLDSLRLIRSFSCNSSYQKTSSALATATCVKKCATD